MTTVGLTRSSRPRAAIDIAGTAWPLYKLEALVVGLLVFLTVLVVAQALQPAVLVGAAATVVVWWMRRPTPLEHRPALKHRRTLTTPSVSIRRLFGYEPHSPARPRDKFLTHP